MPKEFPNEVNLSLFEHLGELRTRLFYSILLTLAFTILGFFLSEKIYLILISAVPDDMVKKSFTLIGPFFLTVKLSFYFGIFMSLPVYAYQAYAFIGPALRKKEGRFGVVFLVSGWFLLLLALGFTYQVLPLLISSLLTWAPQDVVNEADIISYISMILTVYIGFSVLFQVPLVIFLTIVQGFVSLEFYASNRRWVVVILLILCAIFSPPDILSQVLIFIPLYILFELALLAGRLFKR